MICNSRKQPNLGNSGYTQPISTNFKNRIYTYTNRCACVCVCICTCVYIHIYTPTYTYITPSVQYISPRLTNDSSHVLFLIWKSLQTEQKMRLTWSDFSGRNLVTVREGQRVNQFFQMVCRKAIYEEEKKKNKVTEKFGERGKNKLLSPSF